MNSIPFFQRAIIIILKISEEQNTFCDLDITEDELKNCLNAFVCNKSPGIDRLPYEFYNKFWSDVKKYLLKSYAYSFETGKLNISQKQGINSKTLEENFIIEFWL